MNKLITTIACLICCIVYTQAQNKDNMLSKKEQSIAAISMYAARGNQDSLKVILARGLDCGLTVSEEKEVLTQLYAYCGFPRSMGALVTLMNLTKERAAQGIKDEAGREPSPVKSSDMFVVGGQNQLKLFGRPALGEVLTFAPALDQFLKAHLFGDIFSRDNLDWRTRELSTVAALSVLDGVKNELNTHIAHAKHNGVKNARFFAADATEWISAAAAAGERADVIFMDPPREGSTPQFIESVARMAPKRVVYVSCNPETMARDLALLTKKGYRAEGFTPVDMFPNSEHIEVVCALSRQEQRKQSRR